MHRCLNILSFSDVDSEVEYIRKNSESRLFQELRYASHLGLPAIQLKLYGLKHTNLARILSNYIQKGANFQLWLQVPLNHPRDEVGEWLEGEDKTTELAQEGTTWEWWNNFRLITSSSNKVISEIPQVNVITYTFLINKHLKSEQDFK